jgi:hypothetical protein
MKRTYTSERNDEASLMSEGLKAARREEEEGDDARVPWYQARRYTI